MLQRSASAALRPTGLRWLASKASGAASQLDASERPLAADPSVRKASRQQPSSILEPPLLHDSLSEATYDYRASTRATANPPRLSSITEPDYYLQNSLSDSTYGIPRSLQRIPVRSQGGAKQGRSTMQRIVVASRAAPQGHDPLHDSYSEVDYSSPYKGK